MSHTNKDLVRRYLEASNALDIDGILSVLDRDKFRNVNMAKPPLGFEKDYDAFAAMMRNVKDLIDGSIMITIDEMTAEDDRVAVKAHSVARTAHGVDYSNNYHFLFKIRDGKIVLLEEYLCTLTMAKLLDPKIWADGPR